MNMFHVEQFWKNSLARPLQTAICFVPELLRYRCTYKYTFIAYFNLSKC
jgi:hypothetical protein